MDHLINPKVYAGFAARTAAVDAMNREEYNRFLHAMAELPHPVQMYVKRLVAEFYRVHNDRLPGESIMAWQHIQFLDWYGVLNFSPQKIATWLAPGFSPDGTPCPWNEPIKISWVL